MVCESQIAGKEGGRVTVPDKVYFIHGLYGQSADFFIRRKHPISDNEAEEIGIDYRTECIYVTEFLKQNNNYQYLGSTDNLHYDGWGMNFEGFTEVPAPEVIE